MLHSLQTLLTLPCHLVHAVAVIMRGPAGEIRYGYQVAAQLGSWEATPKNETVLSFTGTLKDVNEYWIQQEPLQVNLRFGRTRWVWDVPKVIRDGKTIHAELIGKPRTEPV